MKKPITLLFTTLISLQPFADTLWCTGKITDVYIHNNSGLYIKPTWGDWKQLCGLDGNINSISSTTCNAWLSIAQVAIAADKDIAIKLEDISGTCEEQPDNGLFPKPTYVRLIK